MQSLISAFSPAIRGGLLQRAGANALTGIRNLHQHGNNPDGKVFVVFGASGALGSALVEHIAQDQSRQLVLADRHMDKLKSVAGSLNGRQAHLHEVDATQPEKVDQLFQHIVSKHKHVDGVVSLVGNVMMSPKADVQKDPKADVAALKDALDTNLVTAYNILQSSAKVMAKQGGGNIVLTSAAVAETGVPGFEAMSAAKAGVEGLVRSAAATYVKQGVRVNAVAPGLTRSGQTEGMTHGGRPEATSKSMHPVKHFAEPRDIACALAFLMNPGTDFITGQVLAVDGGLSTLTERTQN